MMVGPLALFEIAALSSKFLPGLIVGAIAFCLLWVFAILTIVQPAGLFVIGFAAWRAVHDWEKRRALRRSPKSPREDEPCPMCGAPIHVPGRCLGCGEIIGPNSVFFSRSPRPGSSEPPARRD